MEVEDSENNRLFLQLSSCCVVQLEKCSQELGTSTKAVTSSIAQLLSEATQGNENYIGELNMNRARLPLNQRQNLLLQVLR